MRASDITLAVGILIVFFLMYAVNALSQGIKKIQANWPEYQCHPAIIPTASLFGHDPGPNLVTCVSRISGGGWGYLTAPFEHLLGGVGDSLSSIGNTMESGSGLMSMFGGLFGGNMSGIFGMFGNLMVALQHIAATIAAAIYSIFGIFSVITAIISGLEQSAVGIWNGTAGKTMRVLGRVA